MERHWRRSMNFIRLIISDKFSVENHHEWRAYEDQNGNVETQN